MTLLHQTLMTTIVTELTWQLHREFLLLLPVLAIIYNLPTIYRREVLAETVCLSINAIKTQNANDDLQMHL